MPPSPHRLFRLRRLITEAACLAEHDIEWLFSHLAPSAPDQGNRPATLEAYLQDFSRRIADLTKNLDNIAKDWPELRDAIKAKLKDDADKIQALIDEKNEVIAEDPDDPRAAEIDQEMKDLLSSIKSTVDSTPAPSSDQSQGSAGGQASTGQQSDQGSGTSVTGGTSGTVTG